MNTIKELADYCACTTQAIHKAKRKAEERYGEIEGTLDPRDKRITVYTDEDVQKILEFAPKKNSGQSKQKPSTVSPTVVETVDEPLMETRIIAREATVLTAPDLKPATIDLQQWDGAPVFRFDNPLELIDSVDSMLAQVEQALDADLQQRQQKLIESQRAKEKVSDRVRQFQLKAELYRRDAQAAAIQQNAVTQDLSEELQTINSLGKSDGQSPA